ncbi:MAG: hypothetical protein AB7E16_05165 [Candidatus Izemoplasmatales bacterium]|jgi:hypothetical protein
MNNKEVYDSFKNHRDNQQLADFFKVSVPTIKKWNSQDGIIPDYAIRIIELYNQTQNLTKKLNDSTSLYQELKESIQEFFNAQDVLKKIVGKKK